jgi:CHAT domain-containing protein
VWVRLPGSGAGQTWTGGDDALPRQVAAALSRPPGELAPTALLARLAAQRLEPLGPYLEGVRRLVVVPAGRMAGVPVEALTERYTVSYAPSGTVFARLAETRKPGDKEAGRQGPSLLALGDPAFEKSQPGTAGQGGQPEYTPLPGTRREVEAIARLFPRADVLLGGDASEQRLDELARAGKLGQYRFLHLATHGVIDLHEPKRSALILAQDRLPDPLAQARAGKKVYQGRLTMADVLEGWRLDAELVTLSACETARGKGGGGDGFVGFSQALLLAGARGCVVSLWPVDDTATALLMQRIYQNLVNGRAGSVSDRSSSKAEALREAKDWLRNLTSEQAAEQVARLPKLERGGERARAGAAADASRPFAHPYYWSAFILIGDPD